MRIGVDDHLTVNQVQLAAHWTGGAKVLKLRCIRVRQVLRETSSAIMLNFSAESNEHIWVFYFQTQAIGTERMSELRQDHVPVRVKEVNQLGSMA